MASLPFPGLLISYLNLSAQLVSADAITNAFAAMSNASQVILLLPRYAFQGFFPPFYKDPISIEHVFEKILSWKVGAVVISDINEIPGFSDRKFVSRGWCRTSPIPILEMNQLEVDKWSAEISQNILSRVWGSFAFLSHLPLFVLLDPLLISSHHAR
jgi:hypothetical protein